MSVLGGSQYDYHCLVPHSAPLEQVCLRHCCEGISAQCPVSNAERHTVTQQAVTQQAVTQQGVTQQAVTQQAVIQQAVTQQDVIQQEVIRK